LDPYKLGDVVSRAHETLHNLELRDTLGSIRWYRANKAWLIALRDNIWLYSDDTPDSHAGERLDCMATIAPSTHNCYRAGLERLVPLRPQSPNLTVVNRVCCEFGLGGACRSQIAYHWPHDAKRGYRDGGVPIWHPDAASVSVVAEDEHGVFNSWDSLRYFWKKPLLTKVIAARKAYTVSAERVRMDLDDREATRPSLLQNPGDEFGPRIQVQRGVRDDFLLRDG